MAFIALRWLCVMSTGHWHLKRADGEEISDADLYDVETYKRLKLGGYHPLSGYEMNPEKEIWPVWNVAAHACLSKTKNMPPPSVC